MTGGANRCSQNFCAYLRFFYFVHKVVKICSMQPQDVRDPQMKQGAFCEVQAMCTQLFSADKLVIDHQSAFVPRASICVNPAYRPMPPLKKPFNRSASAAFTT